jgi:hypothetical protein
LRKFSVNRLLGAKIRNINKFNFCMLSSVST